MRVHSLNCGTICPFAPSLTVGNARGMVCHVLLLETPSSGLVLVDSGFGLQDVRYPRARLGPLVGVMGLALKVEETAAFQIRKLGFQLKDVRHVVLTHLDFDHAGGLADFPEARVHVLERELIAATGKPVPGRGLLERSRYHGALWAHGPRWCPSPPSRGEAWNGMPAVRELPGLPPEILLVPTPGHTRGHSAVAVLGKRADTPVGSPSGWSLHCGDAYFHRGDVGKAPATPLGLRAFQGLVQMNRTERLASRQKLRALVAAQPDVRVFCAHDPEELP